MVSKIEEDLENKILGIADTKLDAKECFDNFMVEYQQEHKYYGIRTMQECIKSFFGLCPIGKITEAVPETIKSYKTKMHELGLSKSTIYTRLGRVKTWLKWCQANKIITWNPFDNVINSQPKSTARFLTDAELELADSSCRRVFLPIFRLGWLAGLRQGEIFTAQGEDLIFHANGTGSLLLRDTKNGTERIVPLCPEIMQVIGPARTGPLFPGCTYATITYYWKMIKRKANITGKCGFHSTRHTFAKKYLEKGGQETALMHILGHTDLKMISRVYGHFTRAFLAKSIEGMADGIIKPESSRFGVL